MAIKRILVPLLGGDADRATLKTAFAVARRFGGHVEALYHPYQDQQLRRLSQADLEGYQQQLQEASRAYGMERDAAARRLFDEVLAQEGVAYHDGAPPAPGGQPSASWRAVEASLAEAVAHRGGVADLVVVPRPQEDDEGIEGAIAEAALFGSACPVLLAPPAGADRLGERVLIGWNRSVPAERAIFCARPFLERAAEVVVLGVTTAAKQGPSPQEVAEHLAWHGIAARVQEIPPDQRAVGSALLEEARTMGADLLVMGAYARSRLRGMLLGGVTRHVLAHAELPVLMAH